MSEEKSLNFIEEIVEADLASGKHSSILTRFPPEPNGYLHIGHAKSICLNFGLAKKYGGATNLRFDDTNPVTEDTEYVDSIKEDIKWLLEGTGNGWKQELYASDYFEQLYGFAVDLINKGLAYVDDSTSEEIATQKGTPTQPGVNNIYRERTVEENLQLFADMRAGKYKDGEKVLRAKIDMQVPICCCAIRLSIVSNTHTIIVPVILGASTRCMILHMAKAILSKRLPILYVRWSLFRIDRCTIGVLNSWVSILLNNMSLPV